MFIVIYRLFPGLEFDYIAFLEMVAPYHPLWRTGLEPFLMYFFAINSFSFIFWCGFLVTIDVWSKLSYTFIWHGEVIWLVT